MNLTPVVDIQAIEKYAKVKVQGMAVGSSVKFHFEMMATLKDAIKNLLDIQWITKLELLVIFSYNTLGESLYVCPTDVVAANTQIFREEDSQEEEMYG